MVKAGSVEIVGSIDVSSIKHGLREMKRGLDEAKESARAAFGDMLRMGDALKGIAKPLAKIGTAFAGAFLGIASMAPAIAPALARMQADFLRLSRTLGETLRPVFDGVASAFTAFVDFVNQNQGSIDALVSGFDTMATNAGLAWKAMSEFGGSITTHLDIEFGETLNWAIEEFGPTAVAALLGYKFGGPVGGVLAGAGAAVLQHGGNVLSPATTESGGIDWLQTLVSNVMTMGGIGATLGLMGGPAAGITVPGGAAIGGVAGVAFTGGELIGDFLINMFGRENIQSAIWSSLGFANATNPAYLAMRYAHAGGQ